MLGSRKKIEDDLDHDYHESDSETKEFVIPNSKTNLLACVKCGLIKSRSDWEGTLTCENCGPFYIAEISVRITKKFTKYFSF